MPIIAHTRYYSHISKATFIHSSSNNKRHNGMASKEVDDDEFFGDQDEETDEFGAMSRREQLAREEELKNIGYLEAFDETKEFQLQEGFEAGYRETYDAATRIGLLFGKEMAAVHLLSSKSGSSEGKGTDKSQRLRESLIEFEKRPKAEHLKDATCFFEALEKDLEE